MVTSAKWTLGLSDVKSYVGIGIKVIVAWLLPYLELGVVNLFAHYQFPASWQPVIFAINLALAHAVINLPQGPKQA